MLSQHFDWAASDTPQRKAQSTERENDTLCGRVVCVCGCVCVWACTHHGVCVGVTQVDAVAGEEDRESVDQFRLTEPQSHQYTDELVQTGVWADECK